MLYRHISAKDVQNRILVDFSTDELEWGIVYTYRVLISILLMEYFG